MTSYSINTPAPPLVLLYPATTIPSSKTRRSGRSSVFAQIQGVPAEIQHFCADTRLSPSAFSASPLLRFSAPPRSSDGRRHTPEHRTRRNRPPTQGGMPRSRAHTRNLADT